MMTADDRKAIWTLLSVALLGIGVRALGGKASDAPPGEVMVSLAPVERPTLDSVAARADRLARPLAPGEKIDLDRATAFDIARLPRIGPSLAARIVRYRDSAGPFGSVEAFDRVPGVGPSLLEAVGASVSFSRRPRRNMNTSAASNLVNINRAGAEELAALPGIGRVKAAAIISSRDSDGPFRRLDDLIRVPGIGPATLERLRDRVKIP